MLEAEVLGLKYSRYLCMNGTASDTERLKCDFDYSFLVAYEAVSDEEYEVVLKNTAIIHLEKGLDFAFGQFSPTCRNEINRTFRVQDFAFSSTRHAGKAEFDFHETCEHLRNWYPVPESELQNSVLFLASWQEEYISGISCYENDNLIRIGRIFSKRHLVTQKSAPAVIFSAAARRLVFDICNYAINTNKKFLDMGGIDFLSVEKSGISKFKQSFGIEVLPVKIGRWMNDKYRINEYKIREAGYDLT